MRNRRSRRREPQRNSLGCGSRTFRWISFAGAEAALGSNPARRPGEEIAARCGGSSNRMKALAPHGPDELDGLHLLRAVLGSRAGREMLRVLVHGDQQQIVRRQRIRTVGTVPQADLECEGPFRGCRGIFAQHSRCELRGMGAQPSDHCKTFIQIHVDLQSWPGDAASASEIGCRRLPFSGVGFARATTARARKTDFHSRPCAGRPPCANSGATKETTWTRHCSRNS
jgi:hypothetical protein